MTQRSHDHPIEPRDHGSRREAETPEIPEPAEDRDERYLRLAADFENYKRLQVQELEKRSRYASEAAARALLPVLDNLRRALDHAGDQTADDAKLLDGLRLVVQQFEAALADLGVSRVEAVGARFDPALHEAIAGEESDEVDEDTVVAELQPGYQLHDRLLRPALVRVAHPARGAATSSGD